jgi:hypothetical protein
LSLLIRAALELDYARVALSIRFSNHSEHCNVPHLCELNRAVFILTRWTNPGCALFPKVVPPASLAHGELNEATMEDLGDATNLHRKSGVAQW